MLFHMTTTLIAPEVSPASRALGAEIRAAMGRHGVSQRELARRIGMHQSRLSARIGLGAVTELSMQEVMEMADALDVSAEGIIVAALRACRDSNPKPSDPCTIVNRPLTVRRLNRSHLDLAA